MTKETKKYSRRDAVGMFGKTVAAAAVTGAVLSGAKKVAAPLRTTLTIIPETVILNYGEL